MLYLPNKFDRYISALRLHIQISLLKGKNRERYLNKLRKISLAEALNNNEKNALDILKFTNSLLGASLIKLMQNGNSFSSNFFGCGTYLINRRLYTVLLMTIFSNINIHIELLFKIENELIVEIMGYKKTENLTKLIFALNGSYLFEKTTNHLIIKIPIEKTDSESEPVENEWCYILDEFSPVNIWL